MTLQPTGALVFGRLGTRIIGGGGHGHARHVFGRRRHGRRGDRADVVGRGTLGIVLDHVLEVRTAAACQVAAAAAPIGGDLLKESRADVRKGSSPYNLIRQWEAKPSTN